MKKRAEVLQRKTLQQQKQVHLTAHTHTCTQNSIGCKAKNEQPNELVNTITNHKKQSTTAA